MREREFEGPGPLDDPLYAERQIEIGIRSVLGKGVAFHHTVLRAFYNAYLGENLEMTYGGLHENREDAVAVRQEIIDQERNTTFRGADNSLGRLTPITREEADELAAKWEKQSEVIELKEGQEYMPWGESGTIFTHGVDDNTHGSEDKSK